MTQTTTLDGLKLQAYAKMRSLNHRPHAFRVTDWQDHQRARTACVDCGMLADISTGNNIGAPMSGEAVNRPCECTLPREERGKR